MSTTPTPSALVPGMRDYYQQQMLAIRNAFEATGNGAETVAARSTLVDSVVTALWREVLQQDPSLGKGLAIVAIGGYGRKHLFPGSDIDLLFLLDGAYPEKLYKATIRRVCQEMWDCGIRVSPQTRTLDECGRTDSENTEFAIALLDHRFIFGDEAVHRRLVNETLPRRLEREGRTLLSKLAELTLERHGKYGNTIFHLEPSIKECPGGLRDSNFCHWWITISNALPENQKNGAKKADADGQMSSPRMEEFQHAQEFLFAVRCFLHYRASRDDNTLDWQAQDEAAARSIGSWQKGGLEPAYWMRLYFRYARTIERRTLQLLDEAPRPRNSLYQQLRSRRMRVASDGFRVEQGRIYLDAATAGRDPAVDPEVVLHIFEAMAETGARLSRDAEDRLDDSLPLLAAHLEEGAALWIHLRRVLVGRYAGIALRAMHAIGMLELIVPEFHGIDALVVRDAYHRYTVDEHTFVLIDKLHELAEPRNEWEKLLQSLMKELSHPELLYLAGLLHDTGKGRGGGHAQQSVLLAQRVLQHMELDAYESGQVVQLIGQHLDMSLALRRDIFDSETVNNFAARVVTPEMLRMLTLFTFADISAVHPDALTPWKAENLWRLYIATANHMDRNVDQELVHPDTKNDAEVVDRVVALLPNEAAEVKSFLEGFPQRYLRTRTPDQVRSHYLMAGALEVQPVQLDFRSSKRLNELTLVTHDRPMLFANMAGALAAWGMDIVTADAFSNAAGIVVDSFHFNDRFKTLELNPVEHDRFTSSIRDVLTGAMPLAQLLAARARTDRSRTIRVVTDTQISWDTTSSSHSTVMQVVAQDAPGLLRAITATLAHSNCNIEVALIDTEGDMAIDVFYLTLSGRKLDEGEREALQAELTTAITANLATVAAG
jgi:[protein-PII] uridylyltransferase